MQSDLLFFRWGGKQVKEKIAESEGEKTLTTLMMSLA